MIKAADEAYIGSDCSPMKSKGGSMVKRRWNHRTDFFYHPI